MGAFKKGGGFGAGGHKGGFSRGGGDHPRFGGGSFGGRDRDSRPQLFTATCAECRKECEVPFRPSGERPVFCKDCFGGKRDAQGGDFGRRDGGDRSFGKRDAAPSYSPRPAAGDTRIDDLKRQVEAMNKKLDTLISLMGGTSASAPAPVATSKKAPEKIAPDAPALAKVVKKVAKKAAKAKK